MRITVNGETRELDESMTVAALLVRLRGELARDRTPAAAACAVEVNRILVPRRDHDHRVLADGDSVEIVTLVGGG